ncbi:hypothetical protein AVEN_89609-1 [Araneus ventricosus]|uniref:DUF4817 domain-containing protein n=1 Tax=Araneus ventricosus TaxID=182803 RepID=A0A4Y2L701_ARAVE|nr:hypothetical protein AVEN_89609-1 [Araneus ventricosus]
MSAKVSYSTEEEPKNLVFIVKNCYLSSENGTLLLRKWSATFRNRPKPSRAIVRDLKRKFKRFGYVTDDLKGKAGAKVTFRTEEVINNQTVILDHHIGYLIHQISIHVISFIGVI